VDEATLAPDRRTFWLTTSETHPGERAVYTVPVTGGPRTRVTPLVGWTDATLSHDGRMLALLHSTANRPPELFLMPAQPGAQPRQVTESRTEEFRRGPWIEPEIVTFRARDGATVHARIYRPRDLGAQPHGGAVLFVHGAGYLQNVHRGWSTYFREYMFHHLLASRGYTVLDVDFRGSAGYGAAVRTGIYRHMGGKDLTDFVDGARWLVQNEGVDAGRIGIYGGSYGGFITLMGLFTEPETFRSGAALRSVTDWSHYNHWYTSRILNLPQEDTLAYRRSSPIYFAEGLRGDLLIAHGMVDVNVHFQDVVRLAQRLIELGKTNWEMAVYPVEDHAFTRPESWADEYRRIYELFERTLRPGSPPLPASNPPAGGG
jgi:dipeptidyl aminopeptidase/acylaminoacyl peptidase